MSTLKEKKEFVQDMFPHIPSNIINRLFLICEDININITKILDNNLDGIHISLKDITVKTKTQQLFAKDLYYPELFDNSFIDVQDGDRWIEKIKVLHEKISTYKTKRDICKDKRILQYYIERIAQIRENIEILNRKRVLAILKRSLTKREAIDLHGLFTKEALQFASDYICVYRPNEITFVTGRDGHSQSLRPSLKQFVIKKGYVVIEDDGPCIYCKKSNYVT